jgi:deazaflavin-dependent oxidoreductase (nitroreductase family)
MTAPDRPMWLSEVAGLDCCDLTTIGRRSGNPHEIEIWFGVIGDVMYIISGNGPAADWYRNALANPEVTVRVAGSTHQGLARPVADADERRAVGQLMGAKYPWDGDPTIGLTFEAWCYDVPALAIERWLDSAS